ncbi:hypothetical protein L9F63_000390, partial [Diploptera punctata]
EIRWMETDHKETATKPQRDPTIPLTVATLQDKHKNMIDNSAQGLSRSKLTLVITKADNDSNNFNKTYDKLHDKNEENRRLLNSGQKKIVIVPAMNSGTVVSTNAMKQNKNGRFSVTAPNQKTEYIGSAQYVDIPGHGMPLTVSSLRSLKIDDANGHNQEIITPSNQNWSSAFCFSEVASQMSVRSLASIGMGSTDGRKVTIRRVPTSPTELFNIVHSPT